MDRTRQRSIHGFEGPARITTYDVGVGLTFVEDSKKHGLLIRVYEGVVTTLESVLSANHIRSGGNDVNDVPKRYGGPQCIVLGDDRRTILPLYYVNGLCFLPMRKPTEDEMNTMEIIDITPNVIWKPKRNETDSYPPRF